MTFVGFVCCAIAGVAFGSNFIPVKKFEVGDGVVFQWVMCAAIWCGGLVTVGFQDSMEFHPFTMLGGVLWCTGNIMCVQVIKLIGMSMGLMVWGITNSLMGWASGKFGLFGLDKEHIGNPTLNYVGLGLTVLSLALFSHVKTNVEPAADPNKPNRNFTEQLLSGEDDDDHQPADWVVRLNPRVRHVLGFVGACVCGVFFGVNFDPPQYEIDHNGTSKKQFDYIFSHFCGIFATSTLFLLCYCVYKRNDVIVDGRLILPAFGCGVLWAIADVCWFIAIQELQMVVANPIVTALPSMVAGFWGIVLFGEIRGAKNLVLYCSGLVIAVVGVVLVALSK